MTDPIDRLLAGELVTVYDEPIVLDRGSGTLDLRAGGIIAGASGLRSRPALLLRDCHDLLLRPPKIVGAERVGGYDPALEAQHGIEVHGGQNIGIDTPHIQNVRGDFIYIGNGAARVWVHGLTGRGCGRHAVAVTGADRWLFTDVDVDRIGYAFIDLEPHPTTPVMHGAVVGGVANGWQAYFCSAHGAADVSDILLKDLVSCTRPIEMTVVPPRGERRRNWTVENVHGGGIARHHKAVLDFWRIDGLTVTGCSQEIDGKRAGVRASGCTAVELDGNSWPGASSDAGGMVTPSG